MVDTSDRRLKREIQVLKDGYWKGLLQIQPVKFKWRKFYNSYRDTDTSQIGFIAQEVEEHYPELVSSGQKAEEYFLEDGQSFEIKDQKSIRVHQFFPLIVAGLKEQQKEIDMMKETMNGTLKLIMLQSMQLHRVNQILRLRAAQLAEDTEQERGRSPSSYYLRT